MESPYFEINLTLDNGQILLASVYGVVEEGELYISSNSFESARDVYFAEKFQDGSMSQTTYESLISELYEESFDNEISFSNSDSTESNVSGYIEWKDDNGETHPLQYSKVALYDGENNEEIGVTYTDQDGCYSFSFANSGEREIYVNLYPQGEKVVVQSGASNNYIYLLCSV